MIDHDPTPIFSRLLAEYDFDIEQEWRLISSEENN